MCLGKDLERTVSIRVPTTRDLSVGGIPDTFSFGPLPKIVMDLIDQFVQAIETGDLVVFSKQFLMLCRSLSKHEHPTGRDFE
jgi:hypothetical protein